MMSLSGTPASRESVQNVLRSECGEMPGTPTRNATDDTMPIIVEMIRSNPSVAFLTRVKRQQAAIRLTLKIGDADTKLPIPGIKMDTHNTHSIPAPLLK